MLLSELAKRVGGTFKGKDVEIFNIETLENAKTGDISFLFNKKYIKLLEKTKASAVILPDFAPEAPFPTLRSKDPHIAYSRVMNIFKKSYSPLKGISDRAHIDPSCEIGENVSIAPFVFIGKNVKIGDNVAIFPNTTILDNAYIGKGSKIYSNVSIRENVKIGENVILHSAVVVGSDGYGFAKNENGEYEKIPHLGSVLIEDNVEIGAGSTIDRASFGNTIIGQGTKIDNLVHVAHSVKVGKNVLLVAQVGISGSAKIGDNSIMAGKSSLAGHIEIEKNCVIGPLAGVNHDLKEGSVVGGQPAFDANLWKKSAIAFKKLPKIIQDVRKIKKKLNI